VVGSPDAAVEHVCLATHSRGRVSGASRGAARFSVEVLSICGSVSPEVGVCRVIANSDPPF